MSSRLIGSATCGFVLTALLAIADPGTLAGQDSTAPEEFEAFAVNMGTAFGVPRSGQSSVVQITIERWSTAAERQTLAAALLEKGPEGLLNALRKAPRVGFIRTPTSLGWELHYTHQVPGEDGGRRILIATDRRIGNREAFKQARTMDYPFTLIELRLDKHNEGEGKLAVATKVTLSKDKQQIELENYSSEPVRLNNVHRR